MLCHSHDLPYVFRSKRRKKNFHYIRALLHQISFCFRAAVPGNLFQKSTAGIQHSLSCFQKRGNICHSLLKLPHNPQNPPVSEYSQRRKQKSKKNRSHNPSFDPCFFLHTDSRRVKPPCQKNCRHKRDYSRQKKAVSRIHPCYNPCYCQFSFPFYIHRTHHTFPFCDAWYLLPRHLFVSMAISSKIIPEKSLL